MKSIRKVLCGAAAAALLCLVAPSCSSEAAGGEETAPAESPASQPMEGK